MNVWDFLGEACLTNAGPGAYECENRDGTPAVGGTPGFAQLTDNSGNKSGSILYNNPISSTSGLAFEFTQYQYGVSDSGTRRAADGIGFYLTDGSQGLTAPGPHGGSLGYSSFRTDSGTGEANLPGIPHGYLGVGLDTFGNYALESYVGGDNCTVPVGTPPTWINSATTWNMPLSNRVTLRGPGAQNGSGDWKDGYCLLDTQKLDDWDGTTGTNGASAASWGTNSIWGGALTANPTNTQVQAAGVRVRVTVSPVTLGTPYPTIRVFLDYTGTGSNYPATPQLQYTMTEAAPATFKFGFSASTGGDTGSHLIGDVTILSGPTATPDTVTLDQGQTANFTLPSLVTPGGAPLASDPYRFIDPATGNPTNAVTISYPSEGTWTIDQTTGAVSFTPNPGFTGPVTPIGYQVTDENGQFGRSTLDVIYRPGTGDLGKQVEPGATALFPQPELGVRARFWDDHRLWYDPRL